MCDFSLLKDIIFLMFVISNFCTSIGFNMPFIFLTDRAVDEGISEEDAKWLVSVIGISNTVGRVLFGFMADKKGVNRLMLYNSALTICGVATALCPLAYNYAWLVVYACVFGLFIGKLSESSVRTFKYERIRRETIETSINSLHCIHLQIGDFLKEEICIGSSDFFPLRAVLYEQSLIGMGKQYLHIW